MNLVNKGDRFYDKRNSCNITILSVINLTYSNSSDYVNYMKEDTGEIKKTFLMDFGSKNSNYIKI